MSLPLQDKTIIHSFIIPQLTTFWELCEQDAESITRQSTLQEYKTDSTDLHMSFDMWPGIGLETSLKNF